MSVQELESAVTNLSPEELAAFSRWFEEFAANAWDQQIETDSRMGRFGDAGKRARADYDEGRCTPL